MERDYARSATPLTLKKEMSAVIARKVTKVNSSCVTLVEAGTVLHVQDSQKLNLKTSAIRYTSVKSVKGKK